MAPETSTSAPVATTDTRGKGLDLFHNVMDSETSEALFKAMAVLAMGIEATIARSLDRTFLQWPNTAEAAWDILDSVLIRAGISDGKDRPWVSADEAEAA